MQQYKHANITLALDDLQPKTTTDIPNTTTCKQMYQKTKPNWILTIFSGSDFGFLFLHFGFQAQDFRFQLNTHEFFSSTHEIKPFLRP